MSSRALLKLCSNARPVLLIEVKDENLAELRAFLASLRHEEKPVHPSGAFSGAIGEPHFCPFANVGRFFCAVGCSWFPLRYQRQRRSYRVPR